MSKDSVEEYCVPLAKVVKPDTEMAASSLEVDTEEEDEKHDAYFLQSWISSISVVTSLSEFALSRLSDHPICSYDTKTPMPCPCDEECDIESCGSSCSFMPTREIDSTRTIITVDGFSPMHISSELLREKYISVALQTDPIEKRSNCTQTHRRRPRVAQPAVLPAKKDSTVQSSLDVTKDIPMDILMAIPMDIPEDIAETFSQDGSETLS